LASLGIFVSRFGGVGTVSFLTYLGEYAAFFFALAIFQEKLIGNFGFGIYGQALTLQVSGIYLVASGLVAVPIGHFCDKYGNKKFAVLGSVLGAIALFSLLISTKIASLIPFALAMASSLVLLGVGHGTYTTSTLGYTGEMATERDLGKPYSLVELAEFAAYAFGPAFGTLIALTLGRDPNFVISGAVLLVAAGVASYFMPARPNAASGEARSRIHTANWGMFMRAMRNPVVAVTVVTTFVASAAFATFFFYMPIYAASLSGSIPAFGTLFPILASVVAASGVVAMIPFGIIEDSTSRRASVLILGLFVGGVSGIVVFLFPSVTGFVLAALVFGVSVAMVRVSQLVLLAERTDVDSRSAVMGTNHAIEHAAYGLVNLVEGVFAVSLGPGGIFRYISVILLITGLGFMVFALARKVR